MAWTAANPVSIGDPTKKADWDKLWDNSKYSRNATTGEFEGDRIVKGWIQFSGTGAIAIQDSFNVSGITDNGVGNYTITWDTDFANTNYAVVSGADGANEGASAAPTSVGSSVTTCYVCSTGGVYDSDIISVIAIGDQ